MAAAPSLSVRLFLSATFSSPSMNVRMWSCRGAGSARTLNVAVAPT
jgi:hypothetical protein